MGGTNIEKHQNNSESKRKKVAFLTNSLGYGGAERVISRLAPRMDEIYDFSIILFDSSMNAYSCKSRIISLGKGESKNRLSYALEMLSKGFQFKKIAAEENFDCVISFLPIPDIINLIFNKSAKRIINIRVDLNLDLSSGFSSKIKYRIKKLLYKGADAAITLSGYTKNQLINEYKFKKDISVIYNPFDIEKIEKASNESIEEDDLYGDNTIVLMGRLEKQKGFIHFLRAAKILDEKKIVFNAIIIGEGSQRQALEEEIYRLNLGERVKLIGKRDNPFRYIRRAKMFVLSSLYEGFPNSLVEAMACGVPVISTDCKTGPREILYDRPDISVSASGVEYADYGLLVPSFCDNTDNFCEYNVLSDAIVALISDERLCEKYTQKAKERASYFTLNNSVNGYYSLIDNIME